MRPFLAVLAVFIALPLLAQTSLIEQGRAAMNRNDPDAAAALLEKAVAQNPKSSEAHYLLGTAYGTQAQKASIFGQASLAGKTKDEFEKAVALDPNNLDARNGLVEFYTMAPGIIGGSYEKAFAQVAEIKKRDPLMAHRSAAFIYTQQKKPVEARNEYLVEVREYPNSARAHIDVAVTYVLEKNFKAANDEFETALRVEPTYMPAYFRIGQGAVLTSSNYAKGEEALRKYLTYTPKSGEPPLARAHYWLGQIFEKQGKKAEAKASFQASLKLNPSQKDVAEALKRVS
ncbi:MAG: tetratricopeptide repeat protein [Acidobacteria bacterium]|nr:tetratricopeptide repeat protein [Acidobacteriota bacterium]MBV9068408.1 tetratricopeptide repeat protein [Acidobacteriota bacterium]MBV9186116.1 tetratricopeptide repeat protein [Acidobacteriota bacterium]